MRRPCAVNFSILIFSHLKICLQIFSNFIFTRWMTLLLLLLCQLPTRAHNLDREKKLLLHSSMWQKSLNLHRLLRPLAFFNALRGRNRRDSVSNDFSTVVNFPKCPLIRSHWVIVSLCEDVRLGNKHFLRHVCRTETTGDWEKRDSTMCEKG